jgi:DeoR family fructose operon transcriptional repressor
MSCDFHYLPKGGVIIKQEKKQPLFAEERHTQIEQMLLENTKLMVPQLCDTFHVSPATIRNDLRDLEQKGKLKRTHGGAIPAGKAAFELDSARKKVVNITAKQQIAAFCASLIEENDTIALDCGSTLLELAKSLPKLKRLTVVTNDIRIAAYLEEENNCSIIVIGGILRHGFECTVGPMAISSLTGLNVDKAFLGANAFSISNGFTTPDINQAEIKKAIIHSASRKFVLCDSSKFDKTSFVEFASINDIDHVITDSKAPKHILDYFHDCSTTVELTQV